jgi:hypothetical protein
VTNDCINDGAGPEGGPALGGGRQSVLEELRARLRDGDRRGAHFEQARPRRAPRSLRPRDPTDPTDPTDFTQVRADLAGRLAEAKLDLRELRAVPLCLSLIAAGRASCLMPPAGIGCGAVRRFDNNITLRCAATTATARGPRRTRCGRKSPRRPPTRGGAHSTPRTECTHRTNARSPLLPRPTDKALSGHR